MMSWSPSTTASATPVTTTHCGVSQSAGVNVRVAGETVASPSSSLVTVSTTSPAGSAVSTTLSESRPPPSATLVVPSVGVTVMPATSSSTTVTIASAGAAGAYSSLDWAGATATVTVTAWSPSTTASSWPVTSTVCGWSQLAGVNVRVAGLTVASSGSSLVTVSTTSPAPSPLSATLRESWLPPSVTLVVPSLAVAVSPATSLSVIVPTASESASVAFTGSVSASLKTSLTPSSKSSPLTVTVTCCVRASPGVKVRVP